VRPRSDHNFLVLLMQLIRILQQLQSVPIRPFRRWRIDYRPSYCKIFSCCTRCRGLQRTHRLRSENNRRKSTHLFSSPSHGIRPRSTVGNSGPISIFPIGTGETCRCPRWSNGLIARGSSAFTSHSQKNRSHCGAQQRGQESRAVTDTCFGKH
jgi:hypothetical protein